MSPFDQAGAGRSDREDRTARPGRPPARHREDAPQDDVAPHAGERPADLTPAATDSVDEQTPDQAAGRSAPQADQRTADDARTQEPVGVPNRANEARVRLMPRGWPRKQTASLWERLAQPRPPLPILVGGAEGGVGTSTVTALLAELIAAASPGPTIAVDQCGTAWGSLTRRLVGQQVGLRAGLARTLLGEHVDPREVISMAPTTSAGAALIDDRAGYTSLHELLRLISVTSGAMTVDAGRVDNVFAARLDLQPVVVVVGRADVIGAEAACAAVTFLRELATRARLPAEPVVVLSSVGATGSSTERRRSQAATTLVAATGISHLVHLPHDPRLAAGQPLRLDQVGKSTAIAGMRMASVVGRIQGEIYRAYRRPAASAAAAGSAAR
ncbi:hypothetical protein GCM10027436_42840 [Actinophytocola sediminis]